MEKLLNSSRKELFVYKVAKICNPKQSGADAAKGGLTNSIDQSERFIFVRHIQNPHSQ
jgi:hypothetical protein